VDIYIRIHEGIAEEFIPEESNIFPGITVTERYSAEFLSSCIVRSEDAIQAQGIKQGMHYDASTDTFYWEITDETSTTEPDERYMQTMNNYE